MKEAVVLLPPCTIWYNRPADSGPTAETERVTLAEMAIFVTGTVSTIRGFGPRTIESREACGNTPTNMTEKTHITWHEHRITRRDREQLNRHRGCVLWFTGLSGSGKSTIANAVDCQLHQRGVHTYLLDGDNVRHGLCSPPELLAESHDREFAERFGLGFSPQDREENIRRIGAVAQLFCSAGLVVLTAFVSPYRKDRDAARRQVNTVGNDGEARQDFIEVFVDTPLEVCESRDPKGLYKMARAGKITDFTGIDAPYEAPISPELILASGDRSADKLAQEVCEYLEAIGKLANSS